MSSTKRASTAARRTLFVLLIGSLVLLALVFRPLAIALIFGAVLAGALWPLQRRLARLLGRRPRLAAGLITIGVILLILGPLVSLSAFLVKEALEAARFISETLSRSGVEGLIEKLPEPVENITRQVLARLWPDVALEEAIEQQVSERSSEAVAAVGAAVLATGTAVFQAAMMLIALFFLLSEKERFLDWIDETSPLEKGQTRELLTEFRHTSGAVLRSSVLTAGVQALAALAGYYLARVPYPIFFAAVTFFVAMIPAVGATAVCLLTAALMLLGGHPFAALFLAIWGVVVVGLVDNLVKPLLIGRGVEMHSVIIFFSLLGGLAAFGVVGLLLGPLAVTFFVSVLRIYRRDYGEGSPAAPPPSPPQTPLT